MVTRPETSTSPVANSCATASASKVAPHCAIPVSRSSATSVAIPEATSVATSVGTSFMSTRGIARPTSRADRQIRRATRPLVAFALAFASAAGHTGHAGRTEFAGLTEFASHSGVAVSARPVARPAGPRPVAAAAAPAHRAAAASALRPGAQAATPVPSPAPAATPLAAWRLLAEQPARPQRRPAGVFGAAAGVDVDEAGQIWVADRAEHVVHVLDAAGTGVRTIGAAPVGPSAAAAAGPSDAPGRLHAPADVAIAAGRVFVSDTGNGRVQVFDVESGGFLASWPMGGAPGGIAARADGSRVYVADAAAARVTVFDAAGTVVGRWGPDVGAEDGAGGSPNARVGFSAPTGIDVDEGADDGSSDGSGGGAGGAADEAAVRVYVADPGAARVWVLGADGAVVEQIDRESATPAYDAPRDVVVTPGGGFVLTTTFRRLYGLREGRFVRLPVPGPYHYGGVGLALVPDGGIVATVQDARAAWSGVLHYAAPEPRAGVEPDGRWGNVPAALGALAGARRVAALPGTGQAPGRGDGGQEPFDPSDPPDPFAPDAVPAGVVVLDRWPRMQGWDGLGRPAGQWPLPEVVDVATMRGDPTEPDPTEPVAPDGADYPADPRGAWLVAPDALLTLDADGAVERRWQAGIVPGSPPPAPGELVPSDGTWLVAGAVAADGTVGAIDAGHGRLVQRAPDGTVRMTGLGGVIVDIAAAEVGVAADGSDDGRPGWWVADRSARALRRLDRDGRETARIAVTVRIDRIAASADGARVAVLGDDGWVRVLATGGRSGGGDGGSGGGETPIDAGTLVAAFVGAPGGTAIDLDMDTLGRVVVVDGEGERGGTGEAADEPAGPGGDEADSGVGASSGRLLWWGPDVAPDAPRSAPPLGDDRCALRPGKRAAPGAVRVGELITVTLTLDGDCPTESAVLDIALVLDRSGSMEGPKLAASRAAAIGFTAELDLATVRVAVLPFSDEGELALGLSADRQAIVRAVAGITASGGTDIGDALERATAELSGARSRAEAAPVIVLLTAGLPESPRAARLAAAAARAAGVAIYAIGLGDDVDAAFLAELTGSIDQVFAVPNEAELGRAYVRIARRLATATLLRTIEIADELPADMAYEEGSAVPPASWDGRTLRWSLTDVPAAGVRLRYRVRPTRAGLRPTNVTAAGDYVDGVGYAGRFAFPVPRVRVAGDRAIWLPIAMQNRCPARRVDVIVVLDASSSMLIPAEAGGDSASPTKLDAARRAARAFVGYLALPADRAGVVAFDDHAHAVHPLSGNRASLERAIDAIASDQGTRIDRGLAAAAELLNAGRRQGAVPVVVLLTDGRTSPGSADAALEGAESLRAAGATIFAVGLGANVDGGFLVAIAGAAERYRYAPRAIGLYDIYRGIALGLPCD